MARTRRQIARSIAISRAIASRAEANDDVVAVGGRDVKVTDLNRVRVELVRTRDAERAYEDAAYGRLAA